MRIAIFEIEKWEQEHLTKALAGHELSFHAEPLTEENVGLVADADIAVVFIYSKINPAVLVAAPKLKMVTTRSMGFDHIDLDACAARGITVCRVPAYGEQTVAEHAFALVMALSRHIFQAYERTEKGIFNYRGLMGFDLLGKTLGVIGGGRIGMNVVRIGRAFGMNVIVHDPYPKPELATQLGFTYASMDELLPQADVVSLHVPYMPATHHLMNGEAFAKLKAGALLVNTSRGGLVDTAALLQALESGRLAGAGLDVIEEEGCFKEEAQLATGKYHGQCDLQSVVRNHALINRDDVILTPHIAWYSREAVERILNTTVENVVGFAAGAPVNLVQTK